MPQRARTLDEQTPGRTLDQQAPGRSATHTFEPRLVQGLGLIRLQRGMLRDHGFDKYEGALAALCVLSSERRDDQVAGDPW